MFRLIGGSESESENDLESEEEEKVGIKYSNVVV